jgi:hypothetical protein
MTSNSTIDIRDCKRRLSLLACVFFACSLMGWSVMVEGTKLTLAIAVIPLVLPLMLAYAAAAERGIMDPTVLFPAFFGLYNGVLLIRFLSDEARNRLGYPVTFGPEVFFRAGVLSALWAIFMALTWAAWKPLVHKKFTVLDVTGWFTVGTVFYAIGVSLYFLQYLQIGGYWAALGMNRVERYQRMTETFSLPSATFVLIGLVMTAASGRNRWLKQKATLVMTALWCVIVMAQGERRMVLQAVFAVACAATFHMAASTRIKARHLLGAILAYAAFTIAGQLRLLIPSLATGRALYSVDSDSLPGHRITELSDTEALLASIKPENTELAGPYLSVLYNAAHVRDYIFGSSYSDTILTFLPRVLYPGTKPLSPTQQLDIEMHRGSGPVSGWGYSPIAEAFLNFGLVGVCLMSSLWMAAFIILSGLRNSDWGLVTAAVLSSESVNANRIDFRTVYLESFFCVVGVLFAALIVRTLYPRPRRPLEPQMVQLAR